MDDRGREAFAVLRVCGCLAAGRSLAAVPAPWARKYARRHGRYRARFVHKARGCPPHPMPLGVLALLYDSPKNQLAVRIIRGLRAGPSPRAAPASATTGTRTAARGATVVVERYEGTPSEKPSK